MVSDYVLKPIFSNLLGEHPRKVLEGDFRRSYRSPGSVVTNVSPPGPEFLSSLSRVSRRTRFVEVGSGPENRANPRPVCSLTVVGLPDQLEFWKRFLETVKGEVHTNISLISLMGAKIYSDSLVVVCSKTRSFPAKTPMLSRYCRGRSPPRYLSVNRWLRDAPTPHS